MNRKILFVAVLLSISAISLSQKKTNSSNVKLLEEMDTILVNDMQLLVENPYYEVQIKRAIRVYDKRVKNSQYLQGKQQERIVLGNYVELHDKYFAIISKAKSDLKSNKKSPTEIAQQCKDSILKTEYWQKKEAIEHRFEYLEEQVAKVLKLIDKYLNSGMKPAKFREEFCTLVDNFDK